MSGPVVTTPNRNAASQVTSTASCGPGRLRLGGGAQVQVTGSNVNWQRIVVRDSYPTGAGDWVALVRISVNLAAVADRASVQAYVICSG